MLIICYTISKVALFYYEYFGDETQSFLRIISALFFILSFVTYAVMVMKWLGAVYLGTKEVPISREQHICSGHSIALLLCWFGVIVTTLAYPNFPMWYDWSPSQLASYTSMFTMYNLLIFASDSFSIEREIICAKVACNIYSIVFCLTTFYQAELDTKSMFIRYISHEIRNPLSSVQLGLDALEEDMILRGESGFRLEVLQEAKAALQLSLVTVNDMLTSDKIRSGFLVLERKKVSLIHWLIPVVHSLQLQVLTITFLYVFFSSYFSLRYCV